MRGSVNAALSLCW